ncbi:c-type cytochrome [Ancylobacter oerskovii]|uniref:C-type cytochrome n=1 Tax=Ancylobacter oerskovii TaxID=459519 RepID=A0ABW4Z1Z9_9HYPH|nr:cytochrome c [Ancylobacter oerskovii]MBS7544876.1 cytochrome c [Ancylobacter oerskovii]
MRKSVLLALAILGGLSAAAQAGDQTDFVTVERGRYLAVLGDCAACHTAPGGKPFAGGVPIETPFGRLVGANITPDRETGIGDWTLEDFQRAMSEGVAKGGYHLYGAMPYTAYTKVTAADNAALFAYLKTLEPVHSEVETNQLPFPFNIRLSLFGWNLLNFTKGEYVPDPKRDAEWNRGAYLVQGLAHCGTCHTPKNVIGGDKNDQFLKGNVVDGWLAPDITGNAHEGIGKWSVDELIDYMKDGANRYDIASGPMAEVVEKSSSQWTDADLKAVATYLKSLDGSPTAPPAPLAASDPRMVAGRAIYEDRCSGCHVGKGEGIAGLFPKLAAAPLVNNADPASLIRVVLAGSRAGATDARPTGPSMPAFAWNLKDEDVANLLTYVRNSWGNAAPPVAAGEVAKLRSELQP